MKPKHCVEYLIDQRVSTCANILQYELEGTTLL